MKAITYCITLAMLHFAAGVSAQETTRLTLKQAIETAIGNNLQVRQAAYQSQVEESNYSVAKGNQLPFLSANINHGLNQGRSIDPFTNSYVTQQIGFANYSINTSVTIWNASSIRNGIKQAEMNYKASEMDWQQQKDNITINVILAYLQVLSAQEQLGIAKKQVDVTRGQVTRLEVLNNSGAIAPSVYYDLKGQLASDELNLVNMKNTLETAKITLARLMNTEYDAGIQLEELAMQSEPVLYEGTTENIYATATKQLAVIKAAEYRKQSARSRLLSAKGQRYPVLSFNGGLGTYYSSVASTQQLIGTADVATNAYVNIGSTKTPVFEPQNSYQSHKISYGDQWKNNFNSSLSIGLQIPILNGLLTKNRIRQAQVLEKRADFESQSIKTQLKQDIDQSYINMNSAMERYQALARQVSDFGVSFRAAEVRFNAGANTSVEYMIAKNNLDRATANLVAARYDYILRTKVLDFYQGRQLW